jgi:hypothetical protein
MIMGYAHYPDGQCKPIEHPNQKLRGFKLNGVRPHTVILLTDDVDYYEGALWTVCPNEGKIYKAVPQ